jgi:RNA polymerase primary sigma factor
MPAPTGKTRPAQAPLETYPREINETPLHNQEEEKALTHRIGDGDREARDRLVRANLRLVVNLTRRCVGRGVGLEDLIEEGNLGLVRAAKGFDPSMGTRFSTYASHWNKQSIRRALVNMGKSVRLPTYVVEVLTKWHRATVTLQEKLGWKPTPEEVARSLNLPQRKLAIIKKAVRVYNSGPQTVQAEAGWSLDEMLVDGHAKTPDTKNVEAEDLHHVLDLLDKTDRREAAVLRLRFGLDDEEPKTLQEIGARLGLRDVEGFRDPRQAYRDQGITAPGRRNCETRGPGRASSSA